MPSLALLLAGLLLGTAQPGTAQESSSPTNLEVYRLLASRIGDSLNSRIPSRDSVRVLLSVRPEATAWLWQGEIAQALQKDGRTIVVALPALFQAELGVLEMRVAYGNVRTEGLFRGKVADREVLLRVAATLVDHSSGAVTLSQEYREALRDTIHLSEIPGLEDPNVPVTQGALPQEGFFSSLVEPLVMLGAVAVAVYLLFTVRS